MVFKFICPICPVMYNIERNDIKEVYTTKCNHLICNYCAMRVAESSTPLQCPICGEDDNGFAVLAKLKDYEKARFCQGLKTDADVIEHIDRLRGDGSGIFGMLVADAYNSLYPDRMLMAKDLLRLQTQHKPTLAAKLGISYKKPKIKQYESCSKRNK